VTELRLPKLYAIIDAEVLRARGVGLREFAEELRVAGVGLVQWRDKVGSPQEVLRGAAVLREVFAGGRASDEEGDNPHDSDDGAVAIMGHPESVGHPGVLLVMNDRADLAVLAGFDGVHVGQGDLSGEDAGAVLAGGGTETREEADSSAALRNDKQGRNDKQRWNDKQERNDKGENGQRQGGYSGTIVGISTHTERQVAAADRSCADYIAIGPVFATGTKADAESVVGLEGVRRARALTTKPLAAIGGITRANARSVVDAGADSVAVISGLFAPGESVEKVARDFLELLR
jgi:thiamine-phosphate pyrophosphorylase